MKLKVVLTTSAIYLAVLGLGFMFVPRQIGIDAGLAEASPALVAYLRIFSGSVQLLSGSYQIGSVCYG